MTYSLTLSSKADDDFLEAWDWYEQQQLGLGDRFETALFEKIDLILANPYHYPQKGKYRVATINDFPFIIIYSVFKRSQLITIASIFHTSRHPRRKFK